MTNFAAIILAFTALVFCGVITNTFVITALVICIVVSIIVYALIALIAVGALIRCDDLRTQMKEYLESRKK